MEFKRLQALSWKPLHLNPGSCSLAARARESWVNRPLGRFWSFVHCNNKTFIELFKYYSTSTTTKSIELYQYPPKLTLPSFFFWGERKPCWEPRKRGPLGRDDGYRASAWGIHFFSPMFLVFFWVLLDFSSFFFFFLNKLFFKTVFVGFSQGFLTGVFFFLAVACQ